MLTILLISCIVAAALAALGLLLWASYRAERRRMRVLEAQLRAEARLQMLSRSVLSAMRAEVRRQQRGA